MEGSRINEISVTSAIFTHSTSSLKTQTGHQKAHVSKLFLSESQTTLAPVHEANKVILVGLLEYLRIKQRPALEYYFYDFYYYNTNNYIAEFINLPSKRKYTS